MFRVNFSLLFLIAVLSMVHTSIGRMPYRRAKKCTIVIDPGHGGIFNGCMSYSKKYMEKTMVLDIATRLEKLLDQENIRVVMTRRSDVNFSNELTTDLQKRVDKAAIMHADLLVSIHLNSAPNKGVRGFELFIPDRAKGAMLPESKIAKSCELAAIFERNLYFFAKKNRGFQEDWNRGIKTAPFYILRNAMCPTVLVELEFITNPGGEADIANGWFRQQYAQILAKSITEFCACSA